MCGVFVMKTADLVAGPQTDALVALARDWEVERYHQGWRVIRGKCIAYHIGVVGWGNPANYSPSSTPAQWAELMVTFDVWLSSDDAVKFASCLPHVNRAVQEGKTHGLAICKAVIAAKWGDEIPDEIWEKVK